MRQETRGYDAESNTTASLRSKADAHDYRYFPDPDLPPLKIPEVWLDARDLPALPATRRARYEGELGVSSGAAQVLVSHPRVAEFFESVLSAGTNAARAANWITTEVMRGVKTHGLDAVFPVSAAQVAELLKLVDEGVISGKQAKEVYAAIEGTSTLPSRVVEERGLKVVSDASELRAVCEQVLAENPKGVEQYKNGKTGTMGFFVGQVMKKTQGSANPKLVNELLKSLLDG